MESRDAFLYMEGKDDKFAQCESCIFWLSKRDRCFLHSEKDVTSASSSCGLYVNGTPRTDGNTRGFVTPKESGLVTRKVRCENCKHFDNKKSTCGLYDTLNKKMPDVFKLDINVKKYACCNAQES